MKQNCFCATKAAANKVPMYLLTAAPSHLLPLFHATPSHTVTRYYIYCLPEPLEKVPTGKWFCDLHKKPARKRIRKSISTEEEYADAVSDDEFSDNQSDQEEEEEDMYDDEGESSEV
jgi:hypothetical protein